MSQEEVHPAGQYHIPRIKSCSRVSPTVGNRATKALVSVCSENGVCEAGKAAILPLS